MFSRSDPKEEVGRRTLNLIKRLWRQFWRPAATISFGGILLSGMALGIIFWGGFNWSMEISSQEEFCIGCHEMRDFVYEESKQFVHYSNRSGVRATCADCHQPKQWGPKLLRKIEASREIYHKILGTIDTPEKFEAHRQIMAERVWASMKATDSRECRNCHQAESMDPNAQTRRAWASHEDMKANGETCIDCHKGIAHNTVLAEMEEELDEDFDFSI